MQINKPEHMVNTRHSLKRFAERGIVIDEVHEMWKRSFYQHHY